MVTKTDKKRILLNLKIDPPLTRKASVICEKIKRLKIIVLETVSLLVCKRVEKDKSSSKDKENPIKRTRLILFKVRIPCFGSLGFSLRTVWSLLSLARANAGSPSVTKFIQSICVGSRGSGIFKIAAKNINDISERFPDKR